VSRGKFIDVRSSIASSFLVASPALTCPFFNHTLILVVEHDVEGSFGFIVNKRSDLEVAAVLEELEVPQSEAAASIPVLLGGPVAPQTGWILFERADDALPENTMPVGESLGLTASLDFFRELAAGNGPSRALLMLGYAGWGPGQLEAELREGSWLPVDLSSRLLFDTPPEKKWRAALDTLGIDPAWVVGRSSPSA
jgi:putative transcriptional regulator